MLISAKPLRKGEVSSKSGPSDSPYTKLKEITDHFRSHILCISAVVWHMFPKPGCVNTTELIDDENQTHAQLEKQLYL